MLVDHLFQGCVMTTRVPLHEIGKVQGDSTNRNHLAKKSKFISPIRPEDGRWLFSVMAPRADVMIYFINYELIKITVQVPTWMRVDHKSRVVTHQMLKYRCCILGVSCDYQQWRKWRFDPWGENLPVVERGPLANTKKKNLRNDVESGCGWVY